MRPKNTLQRPEVLFIKSASELSQCPQDGIREIALAGRSNAGKSSFLNCFSRSHDVAKVSKVPGKTRVLNFFWVGEKYRFVDMPGFGYSTRSIEEINTWRAMIEGFLSSRPNVAGVILFVDSRREWEKLESDLVHWLNQVNVPVVVALTKTDKVTRSSVKPLVRKMKEKIGIEVFGISSEKSEGVFELEDWVFKTWIKGAPPLE